MFSNTFLKTIHTKRWMLMGWSLGIMALVVFTMAFYPSLSKSFGQSLNEMPDSLKAFIGDSSTYSTITGYTDLQIYSQLVTMTLIFGIILFTALMAGEESEGTLQTLLVQPIKRSRIYFEKFASAVILLGASCLSITLGVAIGLVIIGEQIGLVRLLEATFATFLISLVFSSIGFSLGAITGKRGLAGGLAGALAFASLLVTSLAVSVKSLKTIDKFSPFHYFNRPGILQYGPRWSDLAILAGIVVATVLIGSIIFTRRDVYQR